VWSPIRKHPLTDVRLDRGNVRLGGHTPGTRKSKRVLIYTTACYRCGRPGQQQGHRIPSLSSEHTLSTCCRLVSSFLTEMVQQIHSLRASGVMSSQAASAFASDASAFRRSAGGLWTTPPEIRTVVIELSRRPKDQESDMRVQPGVPHFRRQPETSVLNSLMGRSRFRVRSGFAAPFYVGRSGLQSDRRGSMPLNLRNAII
jgi:hypothetical protein